MKQAKAFRHKTLSEEVASFVRKELLLSSSYPPGSFIREEELASRLNISRAPVREGLKILEGLGLLRSVPQKGSLVVDFSREEVEELYDIRYALEDILFREIIRKKAFTESDYSSMNKILSKMLLLGSTEESREETLLEFSAMDMDFHLSVASLAGRQWTLRLLRTVYHQIQQAILKDLATETDIEALVEEHRRILEELRRGDLEAIRRGRSYSYFERRIDPKKEKKTETHTEPAYKAEYNTASKKGEDRQ